MDHLLTELPLLLAALSGGALPGLAAAWHAQRRQRRAAERDRVALARAHAILDLSHDGVALLTPDGQVTWVNARLARWAGRTEGRIAGLSLAALVPDLATAPHGPPATADDPFAWADGQDTFLRAVDGERIPVRLDLQHLPPGETLPGVLVAVMRDLRPARELQRRERLARAELGALLQGTADHLLQMELDARGRVAHANPGLCDWLGRPARSLVGQPGRQLRDRTRSAAFWRGLWDGLSLGHAWRGDLTLDARDRARHVDALLVPLLDEQGRLRRVIAQLRPTRAERLAPDAGAVRDAPASPHAPAPARPARQAVNALALLRSVTLELEPWARGRGVRLHCRGSALAWVDAEAGLLRATLRTLMAHAVRQHDLPGRLEAEARLGVRGDVVLSLEDDGPGWGLRTEPAGGSGAREDNEVAAMRRRMAACGGHLEVQPLPGRGTRVQLHLPVAHGLPVALHGGPRASAATPRNIDVLLVDDDPDRLAEVRSLLSGEPGWRLRDAGGVAVAVGLIAARVPDLVLVGLPARLLLRTLQADPDTAALPVVALSRAAPGAADEGPEDGERFDARIAWPVRNADDFRDTLRSRLPRHRR